MALPPGTRIGMLDHNDKQADASHKCCYDPPCSYELSCVCLLVRLYETGLSVDPDNSWMRLSVASCYRQLQDTQVRTRTPNINGSVSRGMSKAS